MRRLTSATVLIFVFVALASTAETPSTDFFLHAASSSFVPDEFIAVLTPEARSRAASGTASHPSVPDLPSLQALMDEMGVLSSARQFPTAKARPNGSRYPDLTGYYKVRIGPNADLAAVMQAFSRNPHVDHVEKIGIHPIYAEVNDPFYRDPPATFPYDQWHYWDSFGVDANLAWDTETGTPSVVVAVADSGVRYLHSDLGGSDPPGPNDAITNGNVWVNAGEAPGNGIDDDQNGYADDVVGYDFVASAGRSVGCKCCDADCGTADNDPRDHNGHGTHVAGTIAAITNNGNQVAGVAGGMGSGAPGDPANGVRIMALRIGWNASCFGQCGYGFVRMDYAAEAMAYVAEQVEAGVNIAAFNASWGSSDSGGLNAAVDNLLAHDVMLVHAAGNDGQDSPDFLANKAGVMNVAATDQSGAGASFTNHGAWVDVAAPGVDVISTWNQYTDLENDYVAVLGGTSMAAPHVCGVAALVESFAPTCSAPDKFSILKDTANPYNDSRDLGAGIVNARNALDASLTICDATCSVTEQPEVSCADGTDNDCDGQVDDSDSDCHPVCTVTEDPEVSCTDGLDNDCDGFLDVNDLDCQPVCTVTEDPELSCEDGLDNDCDGFLDGDDSDCQGGVCELGQKGDTCSSDQECCSGTCRGRPGRQTCK
jgi:subtilisin family serine protease